MGSRKEFAAPDVHQSTIFTDREVDEKGGHNDMADLKSQARQSVQRLADRVWILTQGSDDTPESQDKRLALSPARGSPLEIPKLVGNVV